jgi:hypothetical protein
LVEFSILKATTPLTLQGKFGRKEGRYVDRNEGRAGASGGRKEGWRRGGRERVRECKMKG